MPTRLRRYDEPGHIHFWTISCYRRLAFFWEDSMKQVVVESLHELQTRRGICLIAYVVMPEHVHIILYPHAKGSDVPIPISKLLHAFKRRVGEHGMNRLRTLWRMHGRLWSKPLNDWAIGAYGKRVLWTTRGYDFNITRENSLFQKVDYCHKNPVTRGLVATADMWKWSSYRYYDSDDHSMLAMDWDGRWPVVW
ncbi:MAG: transposase [Phycisphaerales bacterium]|nr:transposase [Phycisphaerales bacterium]MCB9856015.1 transposase [Phycisphaerales bacterium]